MSKIIWNVDPLHSEIQFKVKHLVISTVTGSFKSFSGKVVTEEDQFENADVEFTIDVNSVDTGQPARDEHLRNADFFEAETYPQFTFASTSFTKIKADLYKLTGNLTIKGITKEVELEAEYGGTEKDSYGNIKVGFEVSGTIDRKDFNVTFNALTETGGLALGEKIKMIANIQLAKQV
ncbi:YceI family protein [Dyadobacter sediminis]|uniref:YceI family protein n=1 Tax=Dyadobacter sediminis TaxID=1493691 RepID=A0A5R9KFC3_9BACT|nr:YceI family protein [Dyadobacter sediminis]TLU94823.1 YceI family protein [Dyadobacter sediminis]GGB87655.1 polyisoprenoid-binding protein [Dyadobacter sediminis]